MINNVKAKKILSKRCIRCLAHIVSKSDEVVLGVKDTLMVQKLPNVFHNSFLRFTLEKKVEFSIKLALGTTPISKTPYRMAQIKF